MVAADKLLVWPLFIRVTHWALAASVLVAFFTGHGGGKVHEIAGYVALACVLLRVVFGFAGKGYVRFSDFVVGPKAVVVYVRSLFTGEPVYCVGHNPLGGWMILVLLTVTLIASMSGLLSITDAYWGDPLVGDTHEASGEAIIWLAGLHVLGVVIASIVHRENLIAAMIFGTKVIRSRS